MKLKTPFLRAALFSFIAFILVFFLFLPFLCDSYLLPHLIETLPFKEKEMSLSRISLWKIRGTLRLAEKNHLVASIPRFELHYSPLDLVKGKLDTLLIDGATLQIIQEKGALSPSKSAPDTPVKESQVNPFTGALPFVIDKIVIRDSRLSLQHPSGNKDLFISGLLRMESTRQDGQYILNRLLADTETTGAINLSSQIKADFNDREIRISTDLTIPNLLELSRILPTETDMFSRGKLATTGEITLFPQNLEIKDYRFDTTVEGISFTTNGVKVEQTDKKSPVLLSVTGESDRLRYTLSNVSLHTSELAIDCTANGTVDLSSETFKVQSSLYSPELHTPFDLDGSGNYSNRSFTADLRLKNDTFSLSPDTSVGPLQLQSNITFKDKILRVRLSGKAAHATFDPLQIAAKDIHWNFSFHHPFKNSKEKQNNTLTIGALHYKNEKTAKLTTWFIQNEDGIDYSSTLSSELEIPGDIRCKGQVQFNGSATAQCKLTPTIFDTNKLPAYITLPEATSATATVSADASLAMSENRLSGSLQLAIKEGTFISGETTITGINTTLHFPNLPYIQSAPSQLVTIGAIDSGKIHLDGGKMFFRIENEKQAFLEKARFRWCGGKIETGSLPLNSSMDSFEATLYCDRLGFAELLQQFGIKDTDGEGSLNGRLPVAFDEGKIFFDDGFLFSTPGNSGIVRFSDTNQLRQGIPDISQSATLDYSIKALENFAYNWTKLTFNTEGENLLLALQLDGEPAEPLPFGYKNGQIVATKKGPGLQHPVRLDMNFRLPLQELFQYGQSLQSMMENM